ncbi:hypothetical protein [Nocardia wallacei]|uniref:hypothetical protein n=1 Tax=Nocardia wallacei TaxID=480035 RepID=UPI002458577D|nr:hypothetical protein [Nocardia wallacei]
MTASTADSGLGNPLSFLTGASNTVSGTGPAGSAQFASLLGGTPPMLKSVETTATDVTDSEYGVGKHYWTVKLHRPAGASAGLKAVIQLAETAIQTAVDLLGRGTPVLPPKVDDLLKPAVYEDLGEGKASEEYTEAFEKVQKRQKALVGLDDEVVKAAIVVADGKDKTLAAIKNIVKALNAKLEAVGGGKLKAAQEQQLMTLIARAVEAVYKLVNAAAEVNDEVAGGSEGAAQGASQAGGGAGGGDAGSLASLLPMLAMIPMGLISMAPAAIDMAQKFNEKQQEQAAGGPPPGDPNAAPGTTGAPDAALAAAPPGDPTAQPPAGAAPPAGTENNSTGAAVLPTTGPLRARRDRPAGNNPAAPDKPAEDPEHPDTGDDGTAVAGAQIIT